MTSSTDLAAFADYLTVQRNLSPKTVTGYVRIIRDLGTTPLEPEAIERWSTAKGGEPSTVGVRLSAVKAWCRFQRIPNPTADIPRPKRDRGLPRPMGDDWRALFAGAEPRFYMAAVFLAESGLRISEACGVDVGRTSPDERHRIPDVLRIVGKGSKTRIVPLTEEARAALAYLGGRIPWGPRALQRRFQELAERTGTPITAHRLRHQFGCDLADARVDLGDIQKLMGHASAATTMGYSEWSIGRQRDALDQRVQYQREQAAKRGAA